MTKAIGFYSAQHAAKSGSVWWMGADRHEVGGGGALMGLCTR